MRLLNIALALEAADSIIDTKKHVEKEVTLYVLVDNLAEIRELAKAEERHEQWNVNVKADGVKMRIRKVNDDLYTATTKEKTLDKFASIETEQEVSKDFFDALKLMSKDGRLKTRYDIPAEETGLKWEIDVFKGKDGTPSRWVKVDYEFKGEIDDIPTLPFEYKEILIPAVQPDSRRMVDKIWNDEWMRIDDEG